MKKTLSLITIAQLISAIFSPIILFTFFYVVALFTVIISPIDKIISTLLVFGIGIVPTLATLFILRKKGLISDYDISKRRQRYLFLSILLVLVIFLLGVGYLLGQFVLVRYFIIFLVWLTCFWAITFFWKISGHTSSITLVFLLVSSMIGNFFLPGAIIIVAVAWARIVEKHHTFWQTIGGILLSVGVYFLARVLQLI